jgi:transposase-like protein
MNKVVVCNECNKSFSSEKFLQKHVISKHSFNCQLCYNTHENKSDLIEHALEHFKNDFLTLAQVKKLRNVTGKSFIVPHQTASQTTLDSTSAATNVPGTSFSSTASFRHRGQYMATLEYRSPLNQRALKSIHC